MFIFNQYPSLGKYKLSGVSLLSVSISIHSISRQVGEL